MRGIEERLLSCFTAGDLALEAFLRISRIELTDAVPSAAVECRESPRLLLNPNFIAQHCETDEGLFMLVLHELHHVLLGHTRLFPRVTVAQNIAFDAVINASLCRRFPAKRFRALFEDSYSAVKVPELFLRPPEGWPRKPRWREPLHEALYAPSGVTYDELLRLIAARCEGQSAPLLLGNHGEDEDVATDPLLRAAVRRIVETWPMTAPSGGRSQGRDLVDLFLGRAPPEPESARVLRRAMWRLCNERGLRKDWGERLVSASTSMPQLRDRRAIVRRLIGEEPLLFEAEVTARAWGSPASVARVYIDISGSTQPWHDKLAAALEPFLRRGEILLHAFSERVIDVRLADLRRGKLLTTQGTEIGCVIDHMQRHRVSRALLVTDGYVGTPRPLRGLRLHVALTPGGHRGDLAPLATEFFQLPKEL